VVNISDYVLTATDVSLLDKGLTFIPTVTSVPIKLLTECTNRNCKNLKHKDYFHDKPKDDYDPKDFCNLFKAPSHWEPKTTQLSLEAGRALNSITHFVSQLTNTNYNNQTQQKESFITCNNKGHNLSMAERQSLRALRDNKNIIIKKADKGGAVVIMDPSLYKSEALRQLLNDRYYREINSSNITTTCHNINTKIHSLYTKGIISNRQYKLLVCSPPTQPRAFYLLPKIHKPFGKWPHPRMPEGRPIVSDVNSETYHVSRFIDYFLQPLSKLSPAYIRDTYDFISKIKNKSIPASALLVTGDVTALYTNMDFDRSIQVVEEFFEAHPHVCRPDREILDLLKICLTCNEFEFAGRLFLQILGTAMGKAFAPSLANMYLHKLDAQAIEYAGTNLDLFSRFIDDIFFIWLASREDLKQFESFLNGLIPGITINLKVSSQHIEFLDVLIYTTPDTSNLDRCIINTKVFFKETDTHQLLHADSHHPKHTTKGILKSQFIRFKRISTTRNDYDKSCSTLFNVLQHRGYTKTYFRKLKNEVWLNHNITSDIQHSHNKPQIWPIINYYDTVGSYLNRYIIEEIKKLKCSSGFKIILCYKKHRNLSNFLTRSRFALDIN